MDVPQTADKVDLRTPRPGRAEARIHSMDFIGPAEAVPFYKALFRKVCHQAEGHECPCMNAVLFAWIALRDWRGFLLLASDCFSCGDLAFFGDRLLVA
jgi:hypothetical protein